MRRRAHSRATVVRLGKNSVTTRAERRVGATLTSDEVAHNPPHATCQSNMRLFFRTLAFGLLVLIAHAAFVCDNGATTLAVCAPSGHRATKKPIFFPPQPDLHFSCACVLRPIRTTLISMTTTAIAQMARTSHGLAVRKASGSSRPRPSRAAHPCRNACVVLRPCASTSTHALTTQLNSQL